MKEMGRDGRSREKDKERERERGNRAAGKIPRLENIDAYPDRTI